MNVEEGLEFRLLDELDDDWMPLWGFVAMVSGFRGWNTTIDTVAGVIRWFAESGLMTFGALANNDVGWEEWNVDIDESMRRIAEGHGTSQGYLHATKREDLVWCEVFRANITEKGERRLAELEAQGMTWDNTIGPFETRSGLL
ncbi:hypothetical protein HQ305_16580 [Rhodococcus sp. BP-149]|uniref:hypothetical protein n=1 Tax=unclassified Rhodococcus (in: high G+C Gram-positive bacteria) TaxID=192944 RepID=UPI001C9A9A20|nr:MULTISPECIES: hypothetical protein [unclassified Rhodococcus (in: high G+C Gram-positive bacteria)]MBY6687176.1 hypothetical protein [Rhodococcus sp. BP-288]MBY6694401.1 hypothetical protein [Rhodococcus sp. BP-188]MBY6698110.1 hypothetical protein [Rhodococcus sp. BP-285]MBY6704330.1 hypothetical protein [Rhodococcus sp. BP-283]MBY6712979.1 hypothetical protein [Rhodococcus sp. BP-160]